jgi:hypothetical protein
MEVLQLRWDKARLFIMSLAVLLLPSCAGNVVYPLAEGSHAPMDQKQSRPKRAVVWSNHAAVGNAIIVRLQQDGVTVVERARLDQVFEEQKIRLTHTPDDDADLLRVGKLLGADHVIFSEATITPAVTSSSYIGRYGGARRTDTVYHLSVSVRSVDVETGEIRWSGTARFPKPIGNPEQGVIMLAQAAMARALCQVESGYEWYDASRWGKSRCIKKE